MRLPDSLRDSLVIDEASMLTEDQLGAVLEAASLQRIVLVAGSRMAYREDYGRPATVPATIAFSPPAMAR